MSESFQGFDQSYLRAIPAALGPRWVGITQVPPDIADATLLDLSHAGVRALHFNMFRGQIDNVDGLVAPATRANAVAGWHAEIYADAAALAPHVDRLTRMAVPLSIHHLGMTEAGLPALLDLVSGGIKANATGFGRVKMDVPGALEAIAARDPAALMFGHGYSLYPSRPAVPAGGRRSAAKGAGALPGTARIVGECAGIL